jgi:ASC-1-like (ASCH) protein
MKPSWSLIPKILTGEKTLESRWYQNRYTPWDKIHPGDTVFFKDSSQPVTAKSTVSQVEQFANLNPSKVRQLLNRHVQADGLGIDPKKINHFYQLFKQKRYCLIIHLENPQPVEPFLINKTGFGSQTAWITVKDINQIKIRSSNSP